MVKITPIAPTQWATYRVPNLYTTSFTLGPGYFVVGYNPLRGEIKRYRPGYIETWPADQCEGENDCFHYDVSGWLNYYPSWYDWSGEPTRDGARKCTVRGTTVSNSYVAIQDGESQSVVASRQTTKTLYGNTSSVWSKYVVRLTNFDVSFTMSSEGLEHSYFTMSWAESWELVEKRGDQVFPKETSGSKQIPAETRGSWWWTKRGTVHVDIPDMNFYLYPLELYDGREHNLTVALRRRADELCAFGDLTAKGAESIRSLDINSLAYARDLANLKDLAKGLTSLAKPGKGLKSISKKVAKGYLATHYGLKLTVQDTQHIADTISKYDSDEYNTQSIGASNHCIVQLPGEPDVPVAVDSHFYGRIDALAKEDKNVVQAFKDLDRALLDLDLAPTAENIWDMIPFSFVVDWFLPVGDALSRREITSYVKTLPVQIAFYSRKFTWAKHLRWPVSTGGIVEGPVVFKIYERQCLKHLITPPMRVDKPKGLGKHWLEATAILIGNL